ncbi:MAG: hypothetical protein ACIAQZ_09790 [Sedimentisphaeraceae bacterium JB056]
MMKCLNLFLLVVCSLFALESNARDLYSDTWVATDAVGRELPGYDECGPLREDKTVGVFYWIWHYSRYGGPYDVSKILAADPVNPQWGPAPHVHHWAEPELGYYDSSDTFVLRKHASMLADAGVDVIIFDTTNSPYTWKDNYTVLCEEFMAMRSNGENTPQIAFMAPFSSPTTVVNTLYEELYEPQLYPDLWFQWDGKPLIMANKAYFTEDSDIYDFFTFRKPIASYFTGPSSYDQWGWLEIFEQHGFYDYQGVIEQVTVGVAQNAILADNEYGAVGTFMSDKNGAMGRSWHNGYKETHEGAVNYGYNFAEQWERALYLDPEFIFITGWNEWTSMRLLEWVTYTAAEDSYYADAMFIDQYNQEYSRDVEPMKGGHSDNYYYQMVSNIRKYKGVSQLVNNDQAVNMTIDGNFSEWESVESVYYDTYGDTIHRNHLGYGSTPYVNTTGRNDIIESKVAFDAYNVYFYAKTAEGLTSNTGSNWMLLFINSDQDSSTGWEGYDYVVNRNRRDTLASLERFTGSDWLLESVGLVSYSYSGNEIEITIARNLINQDGRRDIEFDFHWVDNIQNEGDIAEFAVNGDSAPNRRFNYRYAGSTPSTYFSTDDEFQNWTLTNNLDNGVVSDGILSCDITGLDSYMINLQSFNVPAAVYRYVHIRMKNQSESSSAQVYWTTTTDIMLNENKHKNFAVAANDSGFRDYWLDMGSHSYWNCTIRWLRLDPSSAASGHIEIEFIRLQNRMPVCGDYGYGRADINRNCEVNLFDFEVLAKEWLD